MIRLFSVYYPVRTLVLVTGEAVIICTSLLLGLILRFHEDSYLVLNFEYGYYKVAIVTVLALLFSHGFDLYDPARLESKGELYVRLLLVPGVLALGACFGGCSISAGHAGKIFLSTGVEHSDGRLIRVADRVCMDGFAPLSEGTRLRAGCWGTRSQTGRGSTNPLGIRDRCRGMEWRIGNVVDARRHGVATSRTCTE